MLWVMGGVLLIGSGLGWPGGARWAAGRRSTGRGGGATESLGHPRPQALQLRSDQRAARWPVLAGPAARRAAAPDEALPNQTRSDRGERSEPRDRAPAHKRQGPRGFGSADDVGAAPRDARRAAQ